MIKKQTLSFLINLKNNNHKTWFDAHRKEYQEARTNFLEVISQLIDGLSEFDEDVAMSHLDPKKCIMRINRDIRFSKDKTPYKTNFFTFLNKDGKKSPFGGYYLSVDAEESFCGGGIYMPEASILSNIRQEIDYQFEEWQEIVGDKQLIAHYQEVKPSVKLTRPPKGYDKDNPAIEWIKCKGYYTQKMLNPSDLHAPDFVEQVLEAFRAVKPLIDFINRGIDEP